VKKLSRTFEEVWIPRLANAADALKDETFERIVTFTE
jgi:hypothetical protein